MIWLMDASQQEKKSQLRLREQRLLGFDFPAPKTTFFFFRKDFSLALAAEQRPLRKGKMSTKWVFCLTKCLFIHGPFKSVCFCIIIRPNMITIRSLKAHGLTCHVWFLLAFWKVKGYRFRWWTVFTNAIELWTDEYRGLKAQKKAMQSRGWSRLPI